jgi:hypothetical protein
MVPDAGRLLFQNLRGFPFGRRNGAITFGPAVSSWSPRYFIRCSKWVTIPCDQRRQQARTLSSDLYLETALHGLLSGSRGHQMFRGVMISKVWTVRRGRLHCSLIARNFD